MALLRSIATVGSFTMMSRILGFVRDILVAAILGAGPIADAFFIAFKFPNVFRRLFAEGAFNAAFVPLFAGKYEEDGADIAKKFAEQAFAFLFWVLLVLLIVMELSMPWAMQLFAPGFMDEPEKFDLAVELTRITFPYLLFISLVSLMAGVLNSLNKFAAAAATPVLLNICLIGAILGLTPHMETPGHALAWGVFGAGIVQFIWLFWNCAKHKMVLILRLPSWGEDVKIMVKRIIPGAIGAGIYQVNLLVDMMIATLLPTGSISFLFYADRINQLPLGVVGVAVGTALLPMLSRQLRSGDEKGAMESLNRALEFSLFLTLPAAAAYMVISDPIVSVLFERKEFTSTDSSATAMALFVYAFGLPAYVLNKALTPGFFARGDTKTPMIIAGVCMVVNIVFNLILMGPYLHVGLAMATVISAWTNTFLLAIVLKKRGYFTMDKRLKSKAMRIILSCLIMSGCLYGAMVWGDAFLTGAQVERIVSLIALIGVGLVTYFLSAYILRVARPTELKSMLRRR
ncbi:Protein MurJ homolog [Candidatus Terasakiella magnetica]|uniref:Probable lipid II flippase MurJ n=1 Tax=Candidatus Terasakiella magnetica TaxID=1867952 RepID=A0A1C3RF34_9PROT|nr:murein biosynthesis integral membrane protein MurJ [Candidatus Terasakiella magnetica]SCA55868.1 Protein MurJ homolog [Candidatus Terasakiella magnetica]